MHRSLVALTTACAVLGLSACGETPQTATERKVDDKPWLDGKSAYLANGYQSSDQAAWEKQLQERGQAQNEYNRTPGRP
jgi:hypothetical protein